MPQPRLTQRELARLAGVSHTTISLALRDSPLLTADTKRRILALARRHHYRPDPALAALNAYRINRTGPKHQGTLAWLTSFPERDGWRKMNPAEGYFEGAQTRAEALGYRLEEIWAVEPRLGPGRLTDILLARGISGIVVAPLPEAHGEIKLGWEHFAAVSLGHSLERPRLHVVMNHQFRNMKQLVNQLLGLGYRRIGLAMPAAVDDRVDHNYYGAFMAAQKAIPSADHVLPLIVDEITEAVFLEWISRQRPDAVIPAARLAHRVVDWLRAAGLRVPRDVGVAVASTPFRDTCVSGIDENVHQVGAMAVDTVVGMIHRNETGVPETPWRILADGRWFAGQTVRDLTRNRGRQHGARSS